jgi:hypothetical protein
MQRTKINNRTILSYLLVTVFIVTLSLSGLEKTHAEAAATVNYKMQKKTVTYKDKDKVRGIVSFQYPIVEGDSPQIVEINQILDDAMNAYMENESAGNIKDYTLGAIKNKAFTNDKEQYYWKTDCKVTYNKNNIISMHMKEMWYAGGVYNQTDYGYTFNLKTGKALTAVDVIGGSSKQVKNKLLTAAKAYFKKNYKNSFDYSWEKASASLKSYDVKKYKYYMTPGKAFICFGSDELNCGPDYQVIPLTAKYK